VFIQGFCIGGVVGVKMPCYLLFGDTVDIAAKMESGGEAMKIHISETTERLVNDTQKFKIKIRGVKEINTEIALTTYWLESK
jgi:class 3 adenylate cyclase